MQKEYYLPENHFYVMQYTGPGCAMCGKPEVGHKSKKELYFHHVDRDLNNNSPENLQLRDRRGMIL